MPPTYPGPTESPRPGTTEPSSTSESGRSKGRSNTEALSETVARPLERARPDWSRMTPAQRDMAIRSELEFRKRLALERANRYFEPTDAPRPGLEAPTYGNEVDTLFKNETAEAIVDGYLPPELEITPSNLNVRGKGMATGVDVIDPVNRTGWELTTHKGMARHKTYVLSPAQGPGRTRLLKVEFLTYPSYVRR